jgi:hypothetical protein
VRNAAHAIAPDMDGGDELPQNNVFEFGGRCVMSAPSRALPSNSWGASAAGTPGRMRDAIRPYSAHTSEHSDWANATMAASMALPMPCGRSTRRPAQVRVFGDQPSRVTASLGTCPQGVQWGIG